MLLAFCEGNPPDTATWISLGKGQPCGVSDWVIKFNGIFGTADIGVHVVHTSRVIKTLYIGIIVSNAELWYFLWNWREPHVKQTVWMPVIWDAITLMWYHCIDKGNVHTPPMTSRCRIFHHMAVYSCFSIVYYIRFAQHTVLYYSPAYRPMRHCVGISLISPYLHESSFLVLQVSLIQCCAIVTWSFFF